MDLNDPATKERIEALVKKDTIQIPPPATQLVYGPCWIPKSRWIDGKVVNRYVDFKVDKVSIGRHQLAAFLMYGYDAVIGLSAQHGCNRKSCCNPAHMRLDTVSTNAVQAMKDGVMVPGFPKTPMGENNPNVRIPDSEYAQIKCLLDNDIEWYHPPIAAHHSKLEATAIFFKRSVAAIRRKMQGERWSFIVPVRPPELPTADTVPPQAVAPNHSARAKIADEDVPDLLQRYAASEEKHRFCSVEVLRLKCSETYLRAVLSGKAKSHVRPDIPRHAFGWEVDPKTVQAVRATYCSYQGIAREKNVREALAEKYGLPKRCITHIVAFKNRDIPDDSSAAISLEEFNVRRGLKRRGVVLNEGKVYDALRRIYDGEHKAKLADELGVSVSVIYSIAHGTTWNPVWVRFHADHPGKHGPSGAIEHNEEGQAQ